MPDVKLVCMSCGGTSWFEVFCDCDVAFRLEFTYRSGSRHIIMVGVDEPLIEFTPELPFYRCVECDGRLHAATGELVRGRPALLQELAKHGVKHED